MARINALTEVEAKINSLCLYVDSDSDVYEIIRKAKRRTDDEEILFSIDLDSSQELPHCCGVIELGALELSAVNCTLSRAMPKKDLAILKLLIQYRFLDEKRKRQTKYTQKGIKVCKPVIFCSNGKGECIFVEEALNELTEDFTVVSKSVNPNGRSLITVYISKQ